MPNEKPKLDYCGDTRCQKFFDENAYCQQEIENCNKRDWENVSQPNPLVEFKNGVEKICCDCFRSCMDSCTDCFEGDKYLSPDSYEQYERDR